MQFSDTIEIHISLLRAANDYLPINEQTPSRIRFEILLLLAEAEFSSKSLTVKTLFAPIPHSDTAIRKNLDALLDEGWITLDGDQADRRIRYVTPTVELQKCFTNWLVACDEIFKKINVRNS